MLLTPKTRGIGVIVQDAKTPRAGVLQKAFEKIGIPCPGEIDASKEPDSVTLYIGEKP